MEAPGRILLIEDDASLATNLVDVLSEDGLKVALCNRGDDGLRRATSDECDVVLTDLRLPGLGGLDLVRQLHSHYPRLPVVLMTAHGTIETAIEATQVGAYDYLQKPFEMDELLALLGHVVLGVFAQVPHGDSLLQLLREFVVQLVFQRLDLFGEFLLNMFWHLE